MLAQGVALGRDRNGKSPVGTERGRTTIYRRFALSGTQPCQRINTQRCNHLFCGKKVSKPASRPSLLGTQHMVFPS